MAGLNRSDRLSPFPCLPWCPLRALLSSPLASPTAPAGHTAPGSQRQQLGWVGRRPSRCCSLWLWTHTVRSGPGSTAVQPLSRVGPGERWGRGRGGGCTCEARWSKTASKVKVLSRDRWVRSVSSGSSLGSMSTTIWGRGAGGVSRGASRGAPREGQGLYKPGSAVPAAGLLRPPLRNPQHVHPHGLCLLAQGLSVPKGKGERRHRVHGYLERHPPELCAPWGLSYLM